MLSKKALAKDAEPAVKWLKDYHDGSRRAHDRIIFGKLIEMIKEQYYEPRELKSMIEEE